MADTDAGTPGKEGEGIILPLPDGFATQLTGEMEARGPNSMQTRNSRVLSDARCSILSRAKTTP